MPKLSAFADEISDDLEVQIATLQSLGVNHIELRGVWGKNVLTLSEAEIKTIQRRAADCGIGFRRWGHHLGNSPSTATSRRN